MEDKRSATRSKDAGEEAEYAVVVQIVGKEQPAFQSSMSFAQVLEQIVLPREFQKPFIVAGRTIRGTSDVVSLRIIQDKDGWMSRGLVKLGRKVQKGRDGPKTLPEYQVQVLGILEGHGRDVTGQMFTAFEMSIKERMSEWIPKRELLVLAAQKALVSLL